MRFRKQSEKLFVPKTFGPQFTQSKDPPKFPMFAIYWNTGSVLKDLKNNSGFIYEIPSLFYLMSWAAQIFWAPLCFLYFPYFQNNRFLIITVFESFEILSISFFI